MVYLRGLIILALLCSAELLATATKIAYKKPIQGKANYIKDKRYKPKLEVTRPMNTTTTSSSSSSSSTTASTTASVLNSTPTTLPVDEQHETTLTETTLPTLEYETAAPTTVLDTPYMSLTTTLMPAEHFDATTVNNEDVSGTEIIETETLVGSAATPVASVVTTPNSKEPVPCTCGVFLSSQIQKREQNQPLILNELDRMFPCNAIGRKQCQTKCLEAIVQHLPNSGSIVCATLGKDCHKERAYLFIKNCQNTWWNTSLQAGREYCCKDGQPYRCPLVG